MSRLTTAVASRFVAAGAPPPVPFDPTFGTTTPSLGFLDATLRPLFQTAFGIVWAVALGIIAIAIIWTIAEYRTARTAGVGIRDHEATANLTRAVGAFIGVAIAPFLIRSLMAAV